MKKTRLILLWLLSVGSLSYAQGLMKIIILSLIFFILCLGMNKSGWCASYYVSNSGDDSASGLSEESPWKTIAKVNSFVFSDGDTVCFKRGDAFSDAGFRKISLVDDFTIKDYGDKNLPNPRLDGNVVSPIYIKDRISNLTIKNIDISGQNWQYGKAYNLSINDVNGVAIDGVTGDGHYGGTTSEGKSAIGIINSTNIEVKNCVLYNWGPAIIPSAGKDFMGVVVSSTNSGVINIHDNIIFNVNADCLHLVNCTPDNANVFNNKLYNAGENAIDCKGIQNLNIYRNEMYREDNFTGGGGSSPLNHPLIVVHHPYYPDSLITSHNISIYHNNFHDMPEGSGIALGGLLDVHVKNIRIYKNRFDKIKECIWIGNYISDLSVFYNLIINPFFALYDDYIKGDVGGIYSNNSGINVKIYNNTIYSVEGTLETGINLEACGAGYEVKNNLVYIDKSETNGYLLRTTNWPAPAVIEHNCWFNKSSSKLIKSGSKVYDSSNFLLWQANHAGELAADPKLTVNQRLSSDSPCVDAGADVGLAEDYEGKPVPSDDAVDIGAFEHMAFRKGDINADNQVNVLDVQLCVNVVLGIETREEIVNKARQVTAPQDECNVLDIQAVVNVILNSV